MRRHQKTIFMAAGAGVLAGVFAVMVGFDAGTKAATFDSNVIPSSTATYSLGASGQIWSSINGVLYFSGVNVGINTSTPTQALEVNGGIRLNTTITQPACTATTTRGTFWVTQNAAGVKDDVQVCAKDASNAYSWRTIY